MLKVRSSGQSCAGTYSAWFWTVSRMDIPEQLWLTCECLITLLCFNYHQFHKFNWASLERKEKRRKKQKPRFILSALSCQTFIHIDKILLSLLLPLSQSLLISHILQSLNHLYNYLFNSHTPKSPFYFCLLMFLAIFFCNWKLGSASNSAIISPGSVPIINPLCPHGG